MELITLQVGVLQSNCYILINENKDCLLIDCGGDFDRVYDVIKKRGANLLGVVLTHGHFDHIMGTIESQNYAPVYIYNEEKEFLSDPSLNLSGDLGLKMGGVTNIKTFDEGDFNIGSFKITAYKTAGHTKGSCCLYIDNKLFSGDTIFYGSYGRCDFKSGNFGEIKQSINMILSKFSKDTEIFPGHGISTTVEIERKINPLSEYDKD